MDGVKASDPVPVVVPAKNGDGWYYEASWRTYRDGHKPKTVKRRIGKAWVVPDGDGWKKAPGRTPAGYFDPRTFHVAAAEKVAEYLDQLDAAEPAPETLTFRQIAWEWYEWKATVKGATPATLYNDRCLLAEPGAKPTSPKSPVKEMDGRIMAAWGDRNPRSITPKEMSAWLKHLDKVLPSGRSVNRQRATVSAIYNYAMRPDTHSLPSNPMAVTDKRPEKAKADLDFYEWEETEAVARQFEAGAHRSDIRKTTESELALRRLEDRQDADVTRVLFLAGMRLGEIRAMRVVDVEFAADMSGGLIRARERLSLGVVVAGTKLRPDGRTIPIPEAAARVLASHLGRWAERFGEEPKPGHLVFCSRRQAPLSDSAFRKRYKKACAAAGVRPLRLHDLRHAAGSHVARTAEATFVRDFLGHTKSATTDRYTHSKLAKLGVAKVNEAFAEANESMRGTDA